MHARLRGEFKFPANLWNRREAFCEPPPECGEGGSAIERNSTAVGRLFIMLPRPPNHNPSLKRYMMGDWQWSYLNTLCFDAMRCDARA
jgi:hypothetical protein